MSCRNDAKLFKALSDENRLLILEQLKSEEKGLADISDKLNISQSTISHHMKILTDAGIIDYRKDGKLIYYKMSEIGKKNLTQLILKYMLFCDISKDSLEALKEACK